MTLGGCPFVNHEESQQLAAVVVRRHRDVILEPEVTTVHRVGRRVGERPCPTLAQFEEHHRRRLLHELRAAVARSTAIAEFLHEHLIGDMPLAGFGGACRRPLDAVEGFGARRSLDLHRRLVDAHGDTSRPRGVGPVAPPRVVEPAHAGSRGVANTASPRASERHHRAGGARLEPARTDLVVIDTERGDRSGYVPHGVQTQVVVGLADVTLHLRLKVLQEVDAERLPERRRIPQDPHVLEAFVSQQDERVTSFAPVGETQGPLVVVHVHVFRHAVLVPEVEI